MDDPRVWARGKTAAELLSVADQSVNALYQVATMPNQSQPQVSANGQEIADDDIVDGRALKQFAARYQQPQQDPGTASQLAQLALSDVRNRHAKVFDKFGPEIMGEVAKLPVQLRTVDNIETIVSLVRGRHVDELAEELARTKFASTNGLSVRTSGAASYPGTQGGPVLESEELPAAFRARLAKAGVSEQTVRSFCRASGIKFEDWMKNAKNLDTLIGEE